MASAGHPLARAHAARPHRATTLVGLRSSTFKAETRAWSQSSASSWSNRQISVSDFAALEESLQEEHAAASAAAAEAQRQTGAAMAAIQAVRELAAIIFVGRNALVKTDCKAACLDDKMKSKATHY